MSIDDPILSDPLSDDDLAQRLAIDYRSLYKREVFSTCDYSMHMMSDEEQQNSYFDFSEISKDTEVADSDDSFGSSFKLATREDVVNDRSDTPFDMMIDGPGDFAFISGIECFTQDIVVRILDEADSYSRKGMERSEMNQLESEIKEIIRDDDRVTDVRNVTVQSSERPYENEVQITMALDTDSGQYTSKFFMGDASKVDLSE